ncbi:DUF397 domain-containing protein [Amycolatopsis sp. OK19-0408]|uniref:DUF397 domain-containing protein n=1 Tax=Amycolatopsis iheyensis TaxID=2945988 RepID=A0A9X2NBS2_9PSEU|nr:DUF397 domain-containing protein [Amycolatopsis iheyensis]MCR6484311.1 DUF397 domain-containing protein [Amycolatopsis iheyensis]
MMWRKSSYSGIQTNCVEVALGKVSRVRDTKDRAGGTLALDAAAWGAFLRKTKH